MSVSNLKWNASDRRDIRDPITLAVAITNTDTTTTLFDPTRGIFTGSGGNITMELDGSSTPVLFTGVAAGIVLPLRVVRVASTGTTPTDLVALY